MGSAAPREIQLKISKFDTFQKFSVTSRRRRLEDERTKYVSKWVNSDEAFIKNSSKHFKFICVKSEIWAQFLPSLMVHETSERIFYSHSSRRRRRRFNGFLIFPSNSKCMCNMV